MSSISKTKLVEVEGQQYRLRRLRADVGSYIYLRMLDALMSKQSGKDEPSTAEEPEVKRSEEERARLMCLVAFMRLSFEDLQFAQRRAMGVVAKQVDSPDGGPAADIPLMFDDGRWAVPEIEDDPVLISRLTTEVLVFSLSGFFAQSSGSLTTTSSNSPAATSR